MTVKSNLLAIARELPNVLDQGAEQTAQDVADLARQLVPVDEGDLQATIRVMPKERDGERIVAAGGISGPNKVVDYAAHVEYGTAKAPAQPFLTPAAAQIDPVVRYKALLEELVRRNRL